VPWPTVLFDYSFGTPDVFGAPGQRKLWFPQTINVASLPAAIAARDRQDIYYEQPVAEPVYVPPVPVEPNPWEFVYPEAPAVIHSVLPGPVGGGVSRVPREVIRVEDVSTEVEHHPEGDFPAGSIFAPGQTWGGGIELLDPEEPPVGIDWGGVLAWGLETIAGQQPWQTFGKEPQYTTMGFAAPNIGVVPTPSGIPGRPTTITGYSGGTAVTANGDTCGNRRYVTLDRETGKISCERRRRRRLLTNRDLADLASLKTITGGGAALNAAVIRAVR